MKKLKIIGLIIFFVALVLVFFYPKSSAIDQQCIGFKAVLAEKNNPLSYIPMDLLDRIEILEIYPVCFGIPYGNGMSCSLMEKEIRGMLNEANTCNQATDCTSQVAVGYPFGCSTLVNINSDIEGIEAKYGEYMIKCEPGVYDCDTALGKNEIACLKGKCVDTRIY